jgi:hypothetical protein
VTSLVDVLDAQVLVHQCQYLEDQGRRYWRNTWRLGQSHDAIRVSQVASAGYYAAARRVRWELIRRASPDAHQASA